MIFLQYYSLEGAEKRSEAAGEQYFALENTDSWYSILLKTASNRILNEVTTARYVIALLQ